MLAGRLHAASARVRHPRLRTPRASQLPAHNTGPHLGRGRQRACRPRSGIQQAAELRRLAVSPASGTGPAAKIASQPIGPPGAGSSWYRGRT